MHVTCCRSGVAGTTEEERMGLYVPGAAALAGLYGTVLAVGIWAAATRRRRPVGGGGGGGGGAAGQQSHMILANRNVGLVLGIFSLVGKDRLCCFTVILMCIDIYGI